MKPITETILGTLHIDTEALLDFFVMFSRFEYSLKRANCLNPKKRHAAADWKAFGQTIERAFQPDASPMLAESVHYLLTQPPQTLVQCERELRWEDNARRANECDIQYLLRLVSQVRNNLFHGGKYSVGPVDDVGRDTTLVNACIVVLEYCLTLNTNVRSFFYEVR
jgi:hypothetical protein